MKFKPWIKVYCLLFAKFLGLDSSDGTKRMKGISSLVLVVGVVVFYTSVCESAIPSIGKNVIRPLLNAIPKKPPAVMCSADSLMIYQDCRMCVCPRPNRNAKCFKKSCDLRTKDSGQCPGSVLKMDDSKLCGATVGGQMGSCKVDADCPGTQLCCFDFCAGAKCVNPIPLDASSGMPTHNGLGFQ